MSIVEVSPTMVIIDLILLVAIICLRTELLTSKNRYRLFEVRDHFVRLVAAGDLEEKDEIYIYFVEMLNVLIRNTQRIHLRTLWKAIQQLTDERFVKDRERYQAIIRRLAASKNPKVKVVVPMYFHAISCILWDNSPPLRIIVRIVSWVEKFRDSSVVIAAIQAYEGYKLWMTYKNLDRDLHQSLIPAPVHI